MLKVCIQRLIHKSIVKIIKNFLNNETPMIDDNTTGPASSVEMNLTLK